MSQSANIITSSLPDYVKENRDVLVDEVVLRGPTIDRMAKQTGIKKSAYLNYLNIAPVFQAGAGCGFTPQGDIALTEKTIDVAVIKVNLDVCPENLRGTFAEYLIRSRAGEQSLPYEAEIVAGIRDFIKEALEKAIWPIKRRTAGSLFYCVFWLRLNVIVTVCVSPALTIVSSIESPILDDLKTGARSLVSLTSAPLTFMIISLASKTPSLDEPSLTSITRIPS